MNLDYKEKYLKYKNKYLLTKSLKGGVLTEFNEDYEFLFETFAINKNLISFDDIKSKVNPKLKTPEFIHKLQYLYDFHKKYSSLNIKNEFYRNILHRLINDNDKSLFNFISRLEIQFVIDIFIKHFPSDLSALQKNEADFIEYLTDLSNTIQNIKNKALLNKKISKLYYIYNNKIFPSIFKSYPRFYFDIIVLYLIDETITEDVFYFYASHFPTYIYSLEYIKKLTSLPL